MFANLTGNTWSRFSKTGKADCISILLLVASIYYSSIYRIFCSKKIYSFGRAPAAKGEKKYKHKLKNYGRRTMTWNILWFLKDAMHSFFQSWFAFVTEIFIIRLLFSFKEKPTLKHITMCNSCLAIYWEINRSSCRHQSDGEWFHDYEPGPGQDYTLP